MIRNPHRGFRGGGMKRQEYEVTGMMISTRGRYALRFMIDLAEQEGDGAVTLRAISERQGISTKYLEQIVTALNRAGLIRSVRGNQGGYLLARTPENYTAGDILRAVEGDLSPVSCLSQSPNGCERYSICKSVRFWEGLRNAINGYIDSVTLAELVDNGTDL